MRNEAQATFLIDGDLLMESFYCYILNFEATDMKCQKYDRIKISF